VPGRRQVCAAARMVRTEAGDRFGRRSARSAHTGHRASNISMEKRGDCSLPGRALCKPRIFVGDKGGASVSADRPGSRRFATMAQIESNTMCAARCVMPRLR
jgi:hypothetical protein